MKNKTVSRREFVKNAGKIVAGGYVFVESLSSFSIVDSVANLFAQEKEEKTKLVVVQNGTPEELVKKALESLGGISKFVSKGDVVLVKPNIGFDRKPEQAACTNPEIVGEVVKQCLNAGAKKVKVFDRSVNKPEKCAESSGIKSAVEKAGGEFIFPTDSHFVEKNIEGAKNLKSCKLYKDAFEVDCIINIPIAKNHILAKLTLCLKNWIGLMGGDRAKTHKNLPKSVADLHRAFKKNTRLYIIDAYRILFRHGPTGGKLEDVKTTKTLIASIDPIACESWATSLFDRKPDDIPSISYAYKEGFGEKDVSKLELVQIDLEKEEKK